MPPRARRSRDRVLPGGREGAAHVRSVAAPPILAADRVVVVPRNGAAGANGVLAACFRRVIPIRPRTPLNDALPSSSARAVVNSPPCPPSLAGTFVSVTGRSHQGRGAAPPRARNRRSHP